MYMYLKVKEVDSFLDINYINEPILIKSGCSDMDAVKKWNKEYLLNIIGNYEFNFEKYAKKKDMQIMKSRESEDLLFKDFIQKSLNNNPPYYYLADKDLEQEKNLIDDTIFDDITGKIDYFFGTCEQNNLFVGIDCLSACHIHVTEDFILNQLVGDKIVYLFDYHENYVTTRNMLTKTFNFSRENFFKMSHEGKNIYKVVLKPGDSLCIPPWWWHAVQGVDFSCSITKIFKRKNNKYLNKDNYLFVLSIRQKISEFILGIYIYIIDTLEFLLT